ncbi:MAG: 2-dehydro-3-deoxy-6-phosphogalactonate aldolase [Devosia sp.]
MSAHRHIIAVLRGVTPPEAINVCSTLAAAGITMIEVPLNSPEPFKSISAAAKALAGRAIVGAGTVLTVADVDQVKAAGGEFVVSPDTNDEVITATRAAGMASYPGFFTPSDAFRALRAGATGLKAFPAEVLGPKGIRALKAVLPPAVPVYAVGGANPDNFREYFDAGCTGFGLGTYIFKPGMTLDEIDRRARAAVASYDEGLSR